MEYFVEYGGRIGRKWGLRFGYLLRICGMYLLFSFAVFTSSTFDWGLMRDRVRPRRNIRLLFLAPHLSQHCRNQPTNGRNGGMQIWNFLVSILGALLADRIGRRPPWLLSLVAMICSNIGITITSAIFAKKSSNNPAAYMAVVFLFSITQVSMLLATRWRMLLLRRSCRIA